jgi:photosystem II stability/assembly factor-like uncharacterized protein
MTKHDGWDAPPGAALVRSSLLDMLPLVLGALAFGALTACGSGGIAASGGAAGAGAGASAGTSNPGAGGDQASEVGGGGSASTVEGGSSGQSSAGAASTGVAGSGAAGGPPRVVGSCTAPDGGKLPVGVWENITPAGVSLDGNAMTPAGQNFGTHGFVLDPANSGTVYLGTSGEGIWKTTDCGATWVKVNTGQGAEVGDGRHGSMAIDPVDPNVIFADARYGPRGIYRSKNGGVDWKQVLVGDALDTFIYGGMVEWIAIDPTDHLHVTAMPHFTCQGSHSENCMLETFDGGDTWHAIENTPPSTELGGHVMLDKKTWLVMVDSGIWRTADGGATWAHVFSGTGTFPYLYTASDGTLFVPAGGLTLKSSDGITWTGVDGAPGSQAMAGDGSKLYTCLGWGAGGNAYSAASLPVGKDWLSLPAATNMKNAGWQIHYDADHHVLYSSNFLGGFWRLVTE